MTAQGCSRFGYNTWASAAPFGSQVFMAGLPSDERQIIHPVIAHSNLDLGLSQVLGNVFPDTAIFSLCEGFDGHAGNGFKPGRLCPVMPFCQRDAWSCSGAWSRQDGAERGSSAVGHHVAQAGPHWKPWAACGLPDDPGGWDVAWAFVWPGEASCLVSVVKPAGVGPQCSGDALPDEIWSLGKTRIEPI